MQNTLKKMVYGTNNYCINHTFYNCTTLVEIRIPANIKSLSEGVFDGCSNLTTVTMGNAITKIPTDAFKKCAKLTSIKLSDNITEIGNLATIRFYRSI